MHIFERSLQWAAKVLQILTRLKLETQDDGKLKRSNSKPQEATEAPAALYLSVLKDVVCDLLHRM